MVFLVALYSVALALSIGFFLWSLYAFIVSKKTARKRRLNIQPGPEAEPAIVALYCQYLVAPQRALVEARQALLASTSGQRASEIDSIKDFFEALDLLETRSVTPLR